MKFLGTEITRDIERDMFDYAPRDYEEYAESAGMIGAEASELEAYHNDIADVLAQFFIDTATWGMAKWEQLVGVATDESKPIDQRRSVVKSKLRGIGTVTVSLIKNVAESYSNGEVDVIEDGANYTITVKFVGKLGVPPNLGDIEQVLRDLIPAHVAVDYAFTYVTYDQLKVKYADYDAVSSSGLTYDELLIT